VQKIVTSAKTERETRNSVRGAYYGQPNSIIGKCALKKIAAIRGCRLQWELAASTLGC